MKDRAERSFVAGGCAVVNGCVCYQLPERIARELAKAFQFAGSWHIRDRDVRLVKGNVFKAIQSQRTR